jgi:glycosyltransferase involved in cell wall biosynthesis
MLSIIIVTHNRVNLVQQCIESLISQSQNKHEIIVVDNYSSDNTIGVLKNRYNNRIKIIKTDFKKSLASCKNIGIHEAQGDIIAFTDDDCVPSPDWQDKTISCFESYDCDIAAGPVRLLNKLHFPKWWRPSLNWAIGIAEINSSKFLPLGSNVAFKKNTLINIESKSNTMSCEETVYIEDNLRIITAIKKGYKIKLDKSMVVYHNIDQKRISFNYLIKRSWLEGKHWAKNKKDIKTLVCRLAAAVVNPFRFAISLNLNHILRIVVSLSYIIEYIKAKTRHAQKSTCN